MAIEVVRVPLLGRAVSDAFGTMLDGRGSERAKREWTSTLPA